jgi:hypothetical protein
MFESFFPLFLIVIGFGLFGFVMFYGAQKDPDLELLEIAIKQKYELAESSKLFLAKTLADIKNKKSDEELAEILDAGARCKLNALLNTEPFSAKLSAKLGLKHVTLDENEKEMLKNSWENPALLPFDDAMKYLENYYMPQIANYERVGMINSAYGLAYYFFSMASVHLGFEGKCKILWDMSSRGFKYCKLFDPKKDIPKEFR